MTLNDVPVNDGWRAVLVVPGDSDVVMADLLEQARTAGLDPGGWQCDKDDMADPELENVVCTLSTEERRVDGEEAGVVTGRERNGGDSYSAELVVSPGERSWMLLESCPD